jgi:hypothetical protein
MCHFLGRQDREGAVSLPDYPRRRAAGADGRRRTLGRRLARVESRVRTLSGDAETRHMRHAVVNSSNALRRRDRLSTYRTDRVAVWVSVVRQFHGMSRSIVDAAVATITSGDCEIICRRKAPQTLRVSAASRLYPGGTRMGKNEQRQLRWVRALVVDDDDAARYVLEHSSGITGRW